MACLSLPAQFVCGGGGGGIFVVVFLPLEPKTAKLLVFNTGMVFLQYLLCVPHLVVNPNPFKDSAYTNDQRPQQWSSQGWR